MSMSKEKRRAMLREYLHAGYLYVCQPMEGNWAGRLVMQHPDTKLIFVMPPRETPPPRRRRVMSIGVRSFDDHARHIV